MTRIHGMDGTPEYRTWIDIRRRCHQPQRPDYPRYGGRGIYVCDQWRFGDGALTGFEVFLRDMGMRPEGCSIDRIDNDGPYSSQNCRWATKQSQSRNTRTNVFVKFRGRKVSLKEAAEMAGVNYQTVFSRISLYGWSVEDTLNAQALGPGHTLTGRRPRRT